MFKFTITTAVLCTFIASESQAAFIPYHNEKLNNTEDLVILGKGVRAKHTDQTLALTCETSDCSTLRYAIFNGQDAYAFGPTIYKKDIQKGVTIQRKEPELKAGRGSLLMLGATVGSIFLVPITAVPILIFLGIDALGFLSEQGEGNSHFFEKVDVIGHVEKMIRRKKSKTQEGKVFLNQNGWNWSISPKNVSAERYCETIATILEVPHTLGEECNIQVAKNSFVCEYKAYVSSCVNLLFSDQPL